MTDATTEIITGDCIDEMRDMAPESVHAVVTDPPYGMAFMSATNEWDEFSSPKDYQQWCEAWAVECLRVLKPGAHLIAFGGARTEHRLKSGIEDAGFEIRDTVTYHYGSGLAKGADISKHIDRYYNAEDKREDLGPKTYPDGNGRTRGTNVNVLEGGDLPGTDRETAPATPEAEKWDGWHSVLKPSAEFAALARKPLGDSTICETVLSHGTGGLNTRACETDNGRYPPNTVFSEGVTEILAEQHTTAPKFFYTPKASGRERTVNGQVENSHTTVKPLELMEWIITLTSAKGQRVLDPFAGSGTTIMACRRLGREGIGIEKSEEYAELARKRVELAHEIETDFGSERLEPTAESCQPGLDAFADGGSE